MFNLACAIAGSFAIGIAVHILIDQPLQRTWSRRWMRERLSIAGVRHQSRWPVVLHRTTNQNLTPDALINEEMANLLDAISREMQLGRSLIGALLHTHRAYPLVARFIEPLADSCDRGESLNDALRTAETSTPSSSAPSGVVFGLRTLWVATTGSAGALALERAATTLRQRTAIEYERKAQSAQARLSLRILTWLPIVFLCWQVIANPLAREFLLATPIGWTFLCAGLGLNWFGRQWMNRVIRGVQ